MDEPLISEPNVGFYQLLLRIKTHVLQEEAVTNWAELGVSQAGRVTLEARAAEIEARRQRHEIDIADLAITSPIDGWSAVRSRWPGEYMLGRGRLLVLNDQVDIWMQTNVRKTEAGRLAAGHPVRLEIEADPDLEVAGRITRIGDAATSQFSLLPRLNDSSTFMTVTRRIEARINSQLPDGRLKPG